MATHRVSNQMQLDSAVRAANGGDTIVLGSGTYNKLTLNTQMGANFSQKVTITSADPGRPAVINQLDMRGASNIEIKGVNFDYVPGKTGEAAFVVQGSRNVTLNNVDLEGHMSGAYASGIGLRVSASQGFTILNSEVTNFRNGLNITASSNVTISGNDLRGMSNDAMLLGGLTGVMISGNDFRAMKSSPSLFHKDMIQFYNGSGLAASSNITIRANVIENPEVSHAIFFGNALAKAGNGSAFFRDVLIENNYIRSAHLHGITMDHGSDVTIRGNTLVQNPDKGYKAMINVPLINVSNSSVDVDIVGNRVASVPDERGGWNVSGNVTTGQNVKHWTGGNATSRPSSAETAAAARRDEAPEAAPAEVAGRDADGRGGAQTLQVGGGRSNDGVRFEGVEFADGDKIVFNNFDSGVFVSKRGGNAIDIWNNGGAVKVESALDLQEIVQLSPDVSARIAGDDVILRIVQDKGVSEIVLADLADEFRAADQPDLF
jgi:hypothetical protein